MIEYTVKVNNDGDTYWHLNGKLHRENGPAVEYGNGRKEWYINGKRHREDGPAVEEADGSKDWFSGGWTPRVEGLMHPQPGITSWIDVPNRNK